MTRTSTENNRCPLCGTRGKRTPVKDCSLCPNRECRVSSFRRMERGP